jgi:hypothetical protein
MSGLKGLRVPISFCRFSNLEDGATDSMEFFTTNKTPKMTGHMFEEKFFPRVLALFGKSLVFHPAQEKPY